MDFYSKFFQGYSNGKFFLRQVKMGSGNPPTTAGGDLRDFHCLCRLGSTFGTPRGGADACRRVATEVPSEMVFFFFFSGGSFGMVKVP